MAERAAVAGELFGSKEHGSGSGNSAVWLFGGYWQVKRLFKVVEVMDGWMGRRAGGRLVVVAAMS